MRDLSSPEGEGSLADRLARAIALAGPMPVSQFMAAVNATYYARGTAIGAGGDFTTAPEISQMFGELIGAWVADLWQRSGVGEVAFVELGPGRGTLAADALRVMATAGLQPPVHFVETSSALQVDQSQRVPDAIWHETVTRLPDTLPLIVVANEFFDALPIEQLIRSRNGWHRRLVACQDTLFLPIAGPPVPDAIVPEHLRNAPPGSIVETSPAAVAVVRALAERFVRQGGAMLILDYGYDGPALGESLQAVRAHDYANPFEAPGEVDLSAHVDFAVLGAAAVQLGGSQFEEAGTSPPSDLPEPVEGPSSAFLGKAPSTSSAKSVGIHGPVPQRDFLGQLGISTRAATLAKARPDQHDAIAAAHRRLTHEDAMGTLFRAMAVTAPDWPAPAGFA